MTIFLARLIAVVTLGLTAITANATTYNVSEAFMNSDFTRTPGAGNFSYTFNLNPFSYTLASADALPFLVTSGVITLNGFYDANINTGNGTGSYIETFSNGDTLFGNLAFTDSLSGNNVVANITDSINSVSTVTGGTGLFANATGAGAFTLFAVYVQNTPLVNSFPIQVATSDIFNDFVLTTPDVPPTATPLPAAAWLFGSGIMGLLGLRRKALA